jgi:hypothetical protein
MRQDLLAWQRSHYASGHTTRTALVVHLLTVPLFQLGTLTVLASPFTGGWPALGGLLAMIVALAAQGRVHRAEPKAPEPFLGPLDVVSRLFVEQWITFPRFLLSGGFGAAWRTAHGTKVISSSSNSP